MAGEYPWRGSKCDGGQDTRESYRLSYQKFDNTMSNEGRGERDEEDSLRNSVTSSEENDVDYCLSS